MTSTDDSLRARASRVVPGGMWGHMNATPLPEGYPQYFTGGQGSRLTDSNGRHYVDFMCSWGPIILGHRHPEVEEAARRQMEQGDCMNGPAPVMVELAETLVARIAHADWVQFQKNGGDATTFAVTLARAGTGRRKLLVARGAYHGAVPWCSPSLAGVTTEDRAHILYYDYNDIDSVTQAAEQARGDLAGILVSAFRHDYGVDQALATPEFARAVRKLCDDAGAALVIDDVRAGFRLHSGGSWETLGVRPDLSCFSKAIANGYALSAVAGNDRFRQAATQVYSTGSFWSSAVPMAAGLATQTVLGRQDVVAHVAGLGARLRDGLAERSTRFGLPLRQTGPAQMPMVLFDDDADRRKGFAFCAAALRAGVYFHPLHNMFLSGAHTEADIELALEAAEAGFRAVQQLPPAA